MRFAVAGHAACERPCADLSEQGIAPDRSLRGALDADRPARRPAAAARGSRSTPAGEPRRAARRSPAARRAATRSCSGARTPVYPAASVGDSAGGQNSAFRSAFAGFPAPFGQGPAPGGIAPTSGGGSDAHTHYAFDSAGAGGVVRVIVIDNSLGSLAASDPLQSPAEPQLPWLRGQLADARARGIPSVVMGSRDLNESFTPALNVATDGDEVAQVLVEGGASAYFFERPEENRALRIPAGAPDTIPAFGTGTLGYRSPVTRRGRHARARRAVRRRGLPAGGGRRRPPRRRHQPRAGPRAADPGDRGPVAPADRRHAAAPQPAGALPGARPPAARGRPVGRLVRRRRQRQPTRRRPVRRLPAATVPGGRLRLANRPGVRVHVLGPGDRRLRQAGPAVDEPAQAAAGSRTTRSSATRRRASSARSSRARRP